jgi:hypothetical protein
MSVDGVMMNTESEDGDEPDLDAARGLVPAILLGVALWALAFAIAAYYWR